MEEEIQEAKKAAASMIEKLGPEAESHPMMGELLEIQEALEWFEDFFERE